ncbi:MAG: 4Fe-4S binding protein [Lachnospiraceae bacterium]|nr:4Fe-4S binding protein [Lachnospiraceae bacterium]
MKRMRLAVQLLFTVLTNGYAYGFINGKIYRGGLKYVCVPGLNCYSCPGALASCPIGALQALLNQKGFSVPFGMIGFFFVVGSLLGRFVCGWLCPFGLVQDLLHKIPLLKKRKRLPFHNILKCGKYLVLVFLVGAGSLLLFGGYAKVPAFCKYLCPSGTLFGALPLLGANDSLRGQAGGLFFWKLGILLLIVFLSVKVYRPFCQYLCPLGAIYGWFNRFSLVQIRWEKERCISCGGCEKACPVSLSVSEISRSPECIRCGKCIEACPEKCLRFSGMGGGYKTGGVNESRGRRNEPPMRASR